MDFIDLTLSVLTLFLTIIVCFKILDDSADSALGDAMMWLGATVGEHSTHSTQFTMEQ